MRKILVKGRALFLFDYGDNILRVGGNIDIRDWPIRMPTGQVQFIQPQVIPQYLYAAVMKEFNKRREGGNPYCNDCLSETQARKEFLSVWTKETKETTGDDTDCRNILSIGDRRQRNVRGHGKVGRLANPLFGRKNCLRFSGTRPKTGEK